MITLCNIWKFYFCFLNENTLICVKNVLLRVWKLKYQSYSIFAGESHNCIQILDKEIQQRPDKNGDSQFGVTYIKKKMKI